MLELAKHEASPSRLMRALKVAAHFGELLRCGVLERIDRLFLVTDREYGSRRGPGAGAGGEFRNQVAHDLPLLGAGVLSLVDQKMVDAEVELVMNPGGVDIAEKRERLVDQIVVIDEAAAILLALITAQNLVQNGEQRGRAIPANHGAKPLQERTDTRLFGREPFNQTLIFDGLRNDRTPRGTFVRGAENIEIDIDAVGSRQRGKLPKPARLVAITFDALFKRGGNRRPFVGRNERLSEELGLDAVAGFARLKAKLSRHRGDCRFHAAAIDDPTRDGLAVADCCPDGVAEALIGRSGDGRCQSAADRALRSSRRLE
jgi:hypothetical protein